jgi:predicted amidophosphoribosyltransferase
VSSKRRFACWKCGNAMRKKGLYCKRCKRTRPQSVKAQTVMLTKSLGAKPRPVPVPVAKPPKPRCPNPACRAKGSRKANACSRCGTPFTPAHAMRAEKSARRVQLSIAGSPAYWEERARRQHDPAEREACRAEALKAGGSDVASLMARASGAGSVRQAWLREADPHAREILWQALYGSNGGRSA